MAGKAQDKKAALSILDVCIMCLECLWGCSGRQAVVGRQQVHCTACCMPSSVQQADDTSVAGAGKQTRHIAGHSRHTTCKQRIGSHAASESQNFLRFMLCDLNKMTHLISTIDNHKIHYQLPMLSHKDSSLPVWLGCRGILTSCCRDSASNK